MEYNHRRYIAEVRAALTTAVEKGNISREDALGRLAVYQEGLRKKANSPLQNGSGILPGRKGNTRMTDEPDRDTGADEEGVENTPDNPGE